jgi:hypothetical protein
MRNRFLTATVVVAGCVASIASSDLVDEGGGTVSCTDKANTGACTQFDLSGSDDYDAAKADVEGSCGNTADGDGSVFAEAECEAGVSACDGATGTLENTGETVPLKIVWYSNACDLGVDTQGTCTSLGGAFSGTACAAP